MTGARKCAVAVLSVAGIAVGARFMRGVVAEFLGETSVMKPAPRVHHNVVDYVDMAINMTQGLRH